jgi:hypothetical protein
MKEKIDEVFENVSNGVKKIKKLKHVIEGRMTTTLKR